MRLISLTLELPTPLVEELTRAAKQRDVSPEEHMTRLVELVVALIQNGWDTPLRENMILSLHPQVVDEDGKVCLYTQDTYRVGKTAGESLCDVEWKLYRGGETPPVRTADAAQR